MKRPKLVLGLILGLALLLRLVFLGSIPAGFSPDEASQAYSAYSLLRTGKDEWGIVWPISSFKSFLDYKAPLQTYLMIPSIAVFGLNEFAARLPSALFGTLAVLAIYLLMKKMGLGSQISDLSKTNKETSKIGHLTSDISHLASENVALIAAFFLAISPWHLQFSRTALEVNLSSFLFPMGLYYFLCFLHSEPRADNYESKTPLVLTTIFWGLSLYTYHAAKIFLPLLVLVMAWEYRKTLIKRSKSLVVPAFIGFLIASPLIFGTIFGAAGKRGADLLVTTLSGDQISKINNETFYSKLNIVSTKIPRLFHNPVVFSISQFTENYLSYFSPSFWFTEGGREITYSVIPGRGLLYFWMLPLIIWALFDLLRDKKNWPYLIIILPWLLLAALPAALTKEGYRPNRAGSFALLWEMLAAYGAVGLFSYNFKFKKVVTALFVSFSLILVVFYFEDYAFGSRVNFPTAISYGWREALGFISGVEKDYSSVLIPQGNQPQSFVAFYTKYDPSKFQVASRDWSGQINKDNRINYLDQLGQYRLGKYSFESLDWPEDIDSNTLYLSRPSALLPSQRRTLYRVESADKVIFEIFDFKK